MLRFKINFITGNMKETLRCVSSGTVFLVDGEAQECGVSSSKSCSPSDHHPALALTRPHRCLVEEKWLLLS